VPNEPETPNRPPAATGKSDNGAIPQASRWVERFITAAPVGLPIVDLASGSGRHTRLALAHLPLASPPDTGGHVIAIDRDISRLGELANHDRVDARQTDLENGSPFPLKPTTVGCIIVTNYLHRPILPDIAAALAPSGLLIYETFAKGNEPYAGPSNPDYLLAPGELIAATRQHLIPFAYSHVFLRNPDRMVQRLAAVGPDHVWLKMPPDGQSEHI